MTSGLYFITSSILLDSISDETQIRSETLFYKHKRYSHACLKIAVEVIFFLKNMNDS